MPFKFLTRKHRASPVPPPPLPSPPTMHQPLAYQAVIPSLPEDIWRIVIRFVVRKPGTGTLDLPSPFQGEYEDPTTPSSDPSLITDRKSLRLVSRSWKVAVEEAVAEHIDVSDANELKMTIKYLEKIEGELHLGTRTRFLLLKNFNTLPTKDVERLIGLTPNLVTCVFQDGRIPRQGRRVRRMSRSILKALMLHSRSLKRLELKGAVTPPRFSDLAKLCNSLPRLVTLRLNAVHTYPTPPSHSLTGSHKAYDLHENLDTNLGYMTLPNLKTLSLDSIPRSLQHNRTFAVIWDPSLLYLSKCPGQLPNLERFECDVFPANSPDFFRIHGDKIVHFRTGLETGGHWLVEAIKMCPNLRELVLVHSATADATTIASASHCTYPSLKRICIRPHSELHVEVPAVLHRDVVLLPLDLVLEQVLSMNAPALEEVRVWDVGSLFGIFGQADWVGEWSRKFRAKGVVLCDNAGRQYGQWGSQ